jgi:hypothetical protein
MKATGPPNLYAGHISIQIGIHEGVTTAKWFIVASFFNQGTLLVISLCAALHRLLNTEDSHRLMNIHESGACWQTNSQHR